ncbi:MAG TPA: SRPBCC domain-containing protein [Chthoniobacteraceae bacterium]|nr:SRPBCC domain-containing protein [Chthoniobacteraceae bacterium]
MKTGAPLEFTAIRSIAATPAEVWQAITDPAQVSQYHLAPLRTMELHPGGKVRYGTDEQEMISGKVLEVVPERKLVHTFRFAPTLEGTRDDPESTVSYHLEAGDGETRLLLVHSGFPEENQTYANISGGWPHLLDALKAFVERGR